ncbi:universal stress protein UspG, partial [Escherichia coli]|nr:universal stress protein UspG [Escherichia coli]
MYTWKNKERMLMYKTIFMPVDVFEIELSDKA